MSPREAEPVKQAAMLARWSALRPPSPRAVR
jgi:hypothetical protein